VAETEATVQMARLEHPTLVVVVVVLQQIPLEPTMVGLEDPVLL
jgi:hypothetical protein